MENFKDIRDDQIRIIGEDEVSKNQRGISKKKLWTAIIFIVLIIVIASVVLAVSMKREEELKKDEPAYFEPVEVIVKHEEKVIEKTLGKNVAPDVKGFTEIIDTVINDIPLRLCIPHNAEMSLQIGMPSKKETKIVYVAQAADVRADNGGIVGAFVLKGEPLAWGLSKKGYCASINGKITIGMAENSPLFEQATEQGGYFFRQYPLVSNGVLVENEPKGKTKRRGLCERDGEILIVDSRTEESFHDFAQALVDLGVDQAIYLVGSSSYGWIVDENRVRHEFGNQNYYKSRRRMPRNTSYIVWRKK